MLPTTLHIAHHTCITLHARCARIGARSCTRIAASLRHCTPTRRRRTHSRAITVASAISHQQHAHDPTSDTIPPIYHRPPAHKVTPLAAAAMLQFPNFNRRGLLAIMLGGAALNWAVLHRDTPAMFPAPDSPETMIVRTKGGNPVAVSLDVAGRLYILDIKGNMYYDTGNPQLGWNVITADDLVYNISSSKGAMSAVMNGYDANAIKKTYLGTTKDMVDVPVLDIGGVPIFELRERFAEMGVELQNPVLKVFNDTRPPEEAAPYPVGGRMDRVEVYDPETEKLQGVFRMVEPVLEEGRIELEKRSGGESWLLGGKKETSAQELVKSLKRCRGDSC